MKKILVLFLFSSFVLFGDWGSSDSENLSDIEINTRNSYVMLDNIDDTLTSKLTSMYEILYTYTNYVYGNATWKNSDITQTVSGMNSFEDVIINGNNGYIGTNNITNTINRVLPVNYNKDANTNRIIFNNVDDRTGKYLSFIENPYTSQIGGDVESFIDNWMHGDVLNDMYNYNNTNPNQQPNAGAISENEISGTNVDLNRVSASFYQYRNILRSYVPQNDVLFTLNLSSIGDVFSNITHGDNKWDNMKVEVSLNPSPNREYLYKCWQAWNKFYIDKNGGIIIELCFVIFVILMYWNSFKSILQMD